MHTNEALHEERLAEIKARLEWATPGPWHREHDEYGCVALGSSGWVCAGPNAPEYNVDSAQGRADAELIAHAPDDLRALIAEVWRLRRRLKGGGL